MTTREAQQKALGQLKMLYDEREAANITDWILEHITGKKKIDKLVDKQAAMTDDQLTLLDTILQQLSTHKPIQYVLQEAWFAGLRFFVNENVLIPRPETEELVEWVVGESEKFKVKSQKLKIENQKILDVGTGSGCIPIALKKKLDDVEITAIDISEKALAVAQKNASALNADVVFVQVDFLNEDSWKQLPVFDIIVSNPPYIKRSEESGMAKHVTAFEPSIALFVADEDPLIFYRKIAVFGKVHLNKDGMMFLEINEALGKEVVEMFEGEGYGVELRKDMQGRDRMLRITPLV